MLLLDEIIVCSRWWTSACLVYPFLRNSFVLTLSPWILLMLFPTTACPVSFLFVLSKEFQKAHSLFLKHEVYSGASERGARGASAPLPFGWGDKSALYRRMLIFFYQWLQGCYVPLVSVSQIHFHKRPDYSLVQPNFLKKTKAILLE